MKNVEQPDYTVLSSKENIEIRSYPPIILAETEIFGERKPAITEGFKILADYIFGNNSANRQMKMAAPVTGEISEKIAMTAPVMQEEHKDKWKIRFVMPKKYRFEELPTPNSRQVVLIQQPAKRFAVIQFSGLANDKNLKDHENKLKAYILTEGLKPTGRIIFAFYNSPWTLPFLRRNEVLMEIGEN